MPPEMRPYRSESASNLSIAQQSLRYDSKLPKRTGFPPISRTVSSSASLFPSSPQDQSPNSTSTAPPYARGNKLPVRTASSTFHAAETKRRLVDAVAEAKSSLPPNRRLPSRSASAAFRAAESGSGAALPDRAPEAEQAIGRKLPARCASASFRAAENGKGDLLPVCSTRTRTSSSSSAADWFNQQNTNNQVDRHQEQSRSLRSRKPSKVLLSHEETNDLPIDRRSASREDDCSGFGNGKSSKLRKKNYSMNKVFVSMQVKGFLRIVGCMAITILIIDSYHRALVTSGSLTRFQEDESMVFLHLDRVEQQVRALNEQFEKIDIDDLRSVGAKTAELDDELIKKQMQQLQQMEDELSHEVRTLQTSIQVSDRSSIVKKYGEGPVQVVLDLDFGEKPIAGGARLVILLWYDTPHAAWTLLQQVEAGSWHGASFSMEKGRSIVATPSAVDLGNGGIKFIEKSARQHDPWTIGLNDFGEGGMAMFINLKDNADYHKHDVCVGKIVDGFDALQQLASLSRSTARKVTIKNAKASHLARPQSSNLV